MERPPLPSVHRLRPPRRTPMFPSFPACLCQCVSSNFVIPRDMFFVQREVGVGVPSMDSTRPPSLGYTALQYRHFRQRSSGRRRCDGGGPARALHAKQQQQQQERTWSVHFMQGFERALRSFATGSTAAVSAAACAASPPPADEAQRAVAVPAPGDQQPPASASAFASSFSSASAVSGVVRQGEFERVAADACSTAGLLQRPSTCGNGRLSSNDNDADGAV